MNTMLSERDIVRRCQQSLMGWVFLLVTPLSILPGIPFDADNPVGWWHSVSESYYSNTGIIMISCFIIIGLIGISFKARHIFEKIFMLTMGVGAIGVVLFPHAYLILERTGFFFVTGQKSIFLHFVFAGICFCSMNILCLVFAFTEEKTSSKHKRNVLYISSCILCTFASVVIGCSKIVFLRVGITLAMEFIMFTVFGLSLLCCAGKIPFLK